MGQKMDHKRYEKWSTTFERNLWAAVAFYTGFEAVEKLLEKHAGKYCVGDALSMADVCLIPQVIQPSQNQCIQSFKSTVFLLKSKGLQCKSLLSRYVEISNNLENRCNIRKLRCNWKEKKIKEENTSILVLIQSFFYSTLKAFKAAHPDQQPDAQKQ